MTTVPYPVVALVSTSSTLIAASGPSLHVLDSSKPSTIASTSSQPASSHNADFIRLIAISDDGKVVISHSDDKALKVWDIVDGEIKLRNTRTVTKRGSHISFSPKGDIVFSDRVGDVYVYPIDGRIQDPTAPRPQLFVLAADPTLNPDADFLLGHVSIITRHLITRDGKHIITADRDEHIRVSRYPKSFVIERYLFGSDGFVSALHIPASQPSILLTAGGESSMNIWDWTTGELVSRVDIASAILPHRRVKADPRQVKRRRKNGKEVPAKTDGTTGEVEKEAEEGSEAWYTASEGWMLPSGQGICVENIETIQVGKETVVLFFSLGAAALHSFILSDPASSTEIATLPLSYPLLSFAAIPNHPNHVLLSLDTAWGKITRNSTIAAQGSGAKGKSKEEINLTAEEITAYESNMMVVEVGAGGKLSDVTSQLPYSDIIARVSSSLKHPSLLVSPEIITKLNLYESLRLLPRWPGLEEDDELAGPSDEKVAIPGSLPQVTPASNTPASDMQEKSYTQDELESMGLRALGKLKSKGVDVGDIIKRKKFKGKNGAIEVGDEQVLAEDAVTSGADLEG